MKHFNLYISLFILFFLCSCSSDERLIEENYMGNGEITEIKAVIPDLDMDDVKSRTSFTTGPYGTVPNPVWVVGDSIGIYPDEGDQLSFRITTGGKTCPFSGGGWAMKASSSYTAYFPFQRNYYFMDKKSLPINMLGQTQKGNDNSAHLSAYDILIAKGDKPVSGSLNFIFSRKVALVRLELTAPCAATWKSITLESNAAFTTKAVMDLSLAEPTLTPTAQSNSVSLALENVTTTADNLNIIAYTMLLPVDLTGKSLAVTLKDADDNIYTTNATVTNNKTNIAANAVRWITAKFTEGVAPTIPYVTFMADAAQTLTMSKVVNTLEYSVDGGEWATLGTTTVVFGGEYGDLRLRGNNTYGTNGANISFGNVTPVACTGDIRTLIDYENYETVYTGYAMFNRLFYDCSCLTTAPNLPSTTLAKSVYNGCYQEMFWKCSNLTVAPSLPAITLAKSCYAAMFSECTSLIIAPELPATTLADGCYSNMFSYCSSLTEAPSLPATILADNCYSHMFFVCRNLTKTPTLPATTLADGCYSSMFSYCSGLTETPLLPVTNLAKSCYSYMFAGCSNLKSAPLLPAEVLTEYCYSGMFQLCSSLTSAPSLPAKILAKCCYYAMFSDCTSLTDAPTLSATTLANDCYSYMFSGCTNLTKTPTLPATTLANNCYSYMFRGCANLTEAPTLPAAILADGCYSYMFNGCTSLTKAPTLPATILAGDCYSYMFGGCTNLTEVPTLPATTLANDCYSGMFQLCSSLTSAPSLPAKILAERCYYAMFSDCTSLTEASTLPATTLVSNCYSYMFMGCEKLNSVTMLATDISAPYSMEKWLDYVSPTGTFTKATSMTSLPEGSSGIPSGWTVVDYTE